MGKAIATAAPFEDVEPLEGEIVTDPFEHLSDDELLKEIRRRLGVFASSLVELAAVVGPAIRRGIDLTPHVNPILLDTLRKIESEQIDATLAERYLHHSIFNKLKALPLDDQKEIAATGVVDVVVRRGNSFDLRKLPVDSLTKDQARLVFAKGRKLTQQEQTAILESESKNQEEDEEFPDASAPRRIVWPDKEWRALQKQARDEGKSEGEILLAAWKRRR